MKILHFAAIDIGSNSVKLLIESVPAGGAAELLTKVLMVRVPLRLGEDVFTQGAVSPEKERKLLSLMKAFHYLMGVYEVTAYRACATSAMRDAVNGPVVVQDTEDETGIPIEIIDGNEEASIIFRSGITDLEETKGNCAFVDVGGGSTEITLIARGRMAVSRSFDIGTVRILNRAVQPDTMDRFHAYLTQLAETYGPLNLIGSGGNINKLYKLGGNPKSGRLSVITLMNLYTSLSKLRPAERVRKYKLKPDRADVIVPAAEIFLNIADYLHSKYVYVPTIGIADGIITLLYRDYLRETEEKDT